MDARFAARPLTGYAYKMPLGEYRKKRPARRSAEPRGRRAGKRSHRAPHFVVQHHAARSDHYDFRLEDAGEVVRETR